MDIVICLDNNYVMPSGVLICSVCENNKTEKIRFHVVGDETLSGESKQALSDVTGPYHQEIHFYCVDDNLDWLSSLVGCEGQPQHVTRATFYRLFLASILPTNIDKALYLDSDIIVRHPLRTLWNTDITDYAVGCIADQCEGSISFYNRLRYPPSLGYFNAGVLLVNLAYWREHKLQDEFVGFLKEYPERIRFQDQDVLNYVLRNRKKTLSLKYNLQNGFLHKKLDISWEYEKDLEEAIRDPYIIHYMGSIKPWMKGCPHPFKSEFFKYRQLTQWKDCPLQKGKVKTSLKGKVRNCLATFGIVSKELDCFRTDINI